MNILVTGAKGFIGRNLVAELRNRGYNKVYEYDIDSDVAMLERYTCTCDFVFNLAGINRPQNEEAFMEGNCVFEDILLSLLKKHHNLAPVLLTSSIQASLDNPYGRSKKAAEEVLIRYSQETGSKVYMYRLPNVFGKWCRPYYNSVVATFCHSIAHDVDIQINDPSVELELVYIDDVIEAFIGAIKDEVCQEGPYCRIPISYKVKLEEVADALYSFKASRHNLSVPQCNEGWIKKLYATFLSYLPEDQLSYPLKMSVDERGRFTEVIRTLDQGQFSVNHSKPGITKGNHWHHTKNEKFIVVSGQALIQLRKVGTDQIIPYHVSGEKLEVVDIPPGYTHNIRNEGETELVTLMWCNECFNPEKPDTYFEEV